jgi:GT2 family glycosyltransferase
VRIAAVVVSHGQPVETARCLEALRPQVDDAVVVENVAGTVHAGSARVLVSSRPRGFAANANAGIAATEGDAVVLANPDAVARPGAVGALAAFMERRARCGLAGPQLV